MIRDQIENMRDIDKHKYLERLYQSGMLTDNVFEFLVENEIDLDYLAHLPLHDDQLLKLFNKNRQLCEEAAFTLIDRSLKNNVSLQDFVNTFSRCCNEAVSEYLFDAILLKKDIDSLLKAKLLEAIQFIKKAYSSNEDIFKNAIEFYNFLALRETADIEFINQSYNLNSYIYNIAISQNVNTPIEIINELCSLKNMKFSKIIRINAEKTRKFYKSIKS